MDRLRKYILSNLFISFITMFISLFSIASMVLIIKLATYTAVIQLSLFDLFKLYVFMLPEILFYILPITFFIATALSLFKMSNDNEMIVLFSLGIKPNFIIKTLFGPALFLSSLMFIIFIVLFPHTKVLSENFVSYKKSIAKFNLGASEFGHSFGDWLLYIGKENHDETYSDVILFNKNNKEEILISAKKAQIINESGVLRLKLIDGEGYSYSTEKFSQIDFKMMYINDTMSTNLEPYKNIVDHWQTIFSDPTYSNDRSKFSVRVSLSLFPILCLFFAASISIMHTRHQKTKIYLYLFLGVIIYYGVTFALKKKLSLYLIPTVTIPWIIATYFIYKQKILARF